MAQAPATPAAANPAPASIVLIVLRRLRAPLIALVVIYVVSMVGLTVVPGVDAAGKTAPPLSFFHAFYFVSYTATTIGFGEIPNAFSDAQRLWVTLCIYLSVIGWSYAILVLLALFQDRAFADALARARFARRVRRLGEPFYVICGCGETGHLVTRALDRRGMRFVVVEADENRITELELEDFRTDTPALAGDARRPQNLMLAGIDHPQCRGVVALTDDEAANLAVATTTRLLAPRLQVLARVHTPETAQNLAAIGTQHVIDPFQKFAEYLVLAMREPGCYRLLDWLTGTPGTDLRSEYVPPRGEWVVCGYGRFGKAIVRELERERVSVTILDPAADAADPRIVAGRGTEQAALQAAGVEAAEGLVASTDDDFVNLAIAVAARALNPRLFIVLRQNAAENRVLFDRFEADLVMVSSQIVAHECLATLTTPLLPAFLEMVKKQPDAWADRTIARLRTVLGDEVPVIWDVRVTPGDALAVHDAPPRPAGPIRLADLLRDPGDRERALAGCALMRVRAVERAVLPAEDDDVRAGDEYLFAGTARARALQELTLRNANVLEYVREGREVPAGWLWGRIVALGGRSEAG